MTWRDFFRDYIDTLGVTLFFAVLASGFMLKAREKKVPITTGWAIMVIVAGQLVGCVTTAVVFPYLGWSGFFAPLVGTLSGLIGIFFLMATIGAGERVEMRGADIGDAGLDILSKKLGVKGKEP